MGLQGYGMSPQARMERDLSNRKMYQEEELPRYGAIGPYGYRAVGL